MQIAAYSPQHQSAIRRILEGIGWPEHHIDNTARNATLFAGRADAAAFVAQVETEVVSFIYVEHFVWNDLAQIQGLAVDRSHQRTGIALALVRRAEGFARTRGARGVFVDTPIDNVGGRAFYLAAGYTQGYLMPRYYDDSTDGVTFQLFFTSSPAQASMSGQVAAPRDVGGDPWRT